MVSCVHREENHGRAVSGAILATVARSARLQRAQAVAIDFHELPHHALLSQHLGHGQHQVGGRAAFRSRPWSLNPTTGGSSMETGWPTSGLRLDASHAPPQHAQAVDHGGVGIGAHHQIG